MSAERAYNPLPSPAEPRIPTPIRPHLPLETQAFIPFPEPLPRPPQPPTNVIPFPTHAHETLVPRPYLLSPDTAIHDVLSYKDIPLPNERYKAGKTALHESHHVLLGVSMGVQVEEVSIVPGPGYLGITVFKGDLNHRPDALQIIAAGGAVATLGGGAEGFGHHHLQGSDLHVAHNASRITGKSAEAAVQEASDRLSKIPDAVRQIVADIIETKKTVYSSEQINRIIEIAFFEAEGGIASEYFEKEIVERETRYPQYEASIQRGTTTTIITPIEGPQYVIVEEKKNPLDETSKDFHCTTCSGKKTHTAECKDNDGSTDAENTKNEDTEPMLPTAANIFVRKKHLRLIK